MQFRISQNGLWLGDTLLMQQLTPLQLELLLDESPKVLDVGGRADGPHKVLVFNNRGLYAIHDTQHGRILNLTIVWSPEAEDYSPEHPFSGSCWLNGKLLHKDMPLEEMPLSGEIKLKRFFGGTYSAFFEHFYLQVKFTNVRTAEGHKSRRRVLTSVHFSFSTEDLPKDFVDERVIEQRRNRST